MNNSQAPKRAVVITGGGRGLGKVISEKLARDLAVLVVGRTEADLILTCETIREKGGQAEKLVGDVSDPDTAGQIMAAIQRLGWEVVAVVLNAGVGKSRHLHEISDAEWRSTIGTNLDACFYITRAFLPEFVRRGEGVFCFISSIAGIRGYAYEAPYVASKHAVVGLAKTIALEYGRHGITSVAICPNFIEGEMADRTINGLAKRRGITYQEARKIIEKLNPQQRIIPAEEVAEMVSSVCSNEVPSLSSPIVMGGEVS